MSVQEIDNIPHEEADSKEQQTPQTKKNKNTTGNYRKMQEGDKKQKNLGIITIKPNSNKTFVSAIENVEVEGGMKGGA